jgi:hypothetical protein
MKAGIANTTGSRSEARNVICSDSELTP